MWLPAALLCATLPVPCGISADTNDPSSIPFLNDRVSGDQRREQWDSLGASRWHQLGLRGQGIKIAVLDTGFRGWRSFVGKELPRKVAARSFRVDGNLEARDSQHGILCAEIVHALAPDAELLLANWDTEAPTSFLQAVRWAKDQGARAITCSVIMPSWSDGEGGGQVHAALDQVLGDQLLLFASAGNTAQRHWSGTPRPDARGWHQWREGVVANKLEPWGGERVAVELYGSLECAGALEVVDRATDAVVSQAAVEGHRSDKRGWSQAVVRFEPMPRHTYQVHLKAAPSAAHDAKFHLVALGANLEHVQARGSIPFPGDGARVIAVGAVDRRGVRPPYSSCGPNSPRPKPDLVAMVPFPSQCRDKPFSGTSAAAPQAAALAALWWSRQPAWTAAQVSAALNSAALDLGPAGHDWETGYGLIRLP